MLFVVYGEDFFASSSVKHKFHAWANMKYSGARCSYFFFLERGRLFMIKVFLEFLAHFLNRP